MNTGDKNKQQTQQKQKANPSMIQDQRKLARIAEEMNKSSRYNIDQFNMVKTVLLNFSFNNKGHKTLCMDVIESVMDELRRERKIRMVLADAEIEQYIKLDLSNLKEDDPEVSPFAKQVISDKRIFKEQLCQRVSIIRLGYMFDVLKACYPGKAQMLGADFFEVKQMRQEKMEFKRRANFAAGRNASSMMSSVEEVQVKQSNKVIENTILASVNKQIELIHNEIQNLGQQKIKEFRELLREVGGVNLKKKGTKEVAMDTIEENL